MKKEDKLLNYLNPILKDSCIGTEYDEEGYDMGVWVY